MKLGKVRRLLDAGLNPMGFAVARTEHVSSLASAMGHLKAVGFSPKVVFDIGVAYGTPELYRNFPDAHYHLIDPLKESLPYMQEIAGRLNATLHNCALGDEEGSLEIDVRKDIGGSTLLRELGTVEHYARYKVPVRRFDQLFSSVDRPSLCKIDVQGAELAVLKGMGSLMSDIDVFAIELSLIATLEGGAEFAEVFQHLKENGFVVYDIGGLGRRPIDNALTQMDVIFVRDGSFLRAEKRWCE